MATTEQRTLICGDCEVVQEHSLGMCNQCYSENLYIFDMEAYREAQRLEKRKGMAWFVFGIAATLTGLVWLGMTGQLDVWDVLRAILSFWS